MAENVRHWKQTTTGRKNIPIAEFEKADTGLVVIDGKLIEKPVLREMYRMVSIADRMGL